MILEHYLAGIQYALGDLKADDVPKKVALRDILPDLDIAGR